jgi:filamentous hemagglutinin
VGAGLASLTDSNTQNILDSLYGNPNAHVVAGVVALTPATVMVGTAAFGGTAANAAGKVADTVGQVATNALVDGATSLAKFDNLVAKGGLLATDGTPLMDFSTLTNAQKGVVGELMGANTVENILPDALKIGRTPSIGQTGIDDLYKVNNPGVDYVVVEYKFGTSVLNNTADGVQMSDGWLSGTSTGYNRILESVNNDPLIAKDISNAMAAGRVEKWVVNTDPAGGTSVWLVDSAGKIVKANSSVISKVFGGAK